MNLAYGLPYQATVGTKFAKYDAGILFAVYASMAFVLCFYPVAGFLADTRYGRYNTVIWSLYLLLTMLVMSFAAATLLLPVIVLFEYGTWEQRVFHFLIGPACLLGLAMLVSIVAFNANVIQFGMDQLHDSPADHQSLFIHWYMWLYYFSVFLTHLIRELFIDYGIKHSGIGIGLIMSGPAIILLFLVVSLLHATDKTGF